MRIGKWRTSTASDNKMDCVELAPTDMSVVAVRDSKDPDGPKLLLTAAAFRALLNQAGAA